MEETAEEAALRRARDCERNKRNRKIRYLTETSEEAAIRRARETERSRRWRAKRSLRETAEESGLRLARETETRFKYRNMLKNRTAKLELLLTPFNTVDVFKNVDPSEITKYKQLFPNLEKIADRPVHCTSCNLHIGTAPINEAIIKIHPLLRVIQCQQCHIFYMSRKFELGVDEYKMYCRWCGQGGKVYCCSKCPKVYCRRCIEQNLSNVVWGEIQNNKDWICFACDSACLLQLKADYWALLNFIEEQKKSITNKLLTHTTLYLEMTKDYSKCCIPKIPIRKRKLPKKVYDAPPAKRNMIDRAQKSRPFALGGITTPRYDKPPPNGRLVRHLEVAQSVQPTSQTDQQNIGHGQLVLVRKHLPTHPNASKGSSSGCTSLHQPNIPKSTETQRTKTPTAPRKPPSLLVGKAKYEILVKNSMEVCQHFTGKIKKLTNSKISKCVKTQTDVKDLIISLFYLLKNASTLFQKIQDTCDDDLEVMGFGSDNLKSDDDVEILQSIPALIELDSDENNVEIF